MPHLEPTYLRYIYDGLIKGSIHPENSAELPDGLIGMYEEAFDERTSVVERQKLMQCFAIWALLKKEVSAAFVAEVLGETEDEIQNFISKYSAWFNSPESGKYQLYHERLKVYLLQKLSEKEIHELHEKLISRLEKAIEEQKTDEFEWYGLEFLVGHLGVSAMLNVEGKKLIELANSQAHWQRQLKVSKGFTWTKNGLKELMSWASKYNDDEVIECSLQMVDLHHQEQNAAPQIVALVAEGDFDSALKRIEQFGGNDKEGLQRKFTLYMLCLMELTLLESKGKPFRKDGIEKLLKHLDEQLPVDHSILNWNDFFSSYTMFLIAFECAYLNLDYCVLFIRTDEWEIDSLIKLGIHNNLQYQVLKNSFYCISSEKLKSKTFELIIKELLKFNLINEAIEFINNDEVIKEAKNYFYLIVNELISQGNFEKAIEYTKEISNPQKKCTVFIEISSAQAKQSTDQISNDLLHEALLCARSIGCAVDKCKMLAKISSELFFRSMIEDAELALQEALENTLKISDEFGDQSLAMKAISIEMAKQGKIERALEYSRKIDNTFEDKSLTLCSIFIELASQKSIEDASYVLNEAIDCARNISCIDWKITALVEIAFELINLKLSEEFTSLIEESIEVIKSNRNYKFNELALCDIPKELASLGKLKEAIDFYENLPESISKSSTLKNLSIEFFAQGDVNRALKYAREIEDVIKKSEALLAISTGLHDQLNANTANSLMNETIHSARQINFVYDRERTYHLIISHLSYQKKYRELTQLMQETLELSSGLTSEKDRRIVLRDISVQLVAQGKNSEALDYARRINSVRERVTALIAIFKKLAQDGSVKKAEALLSESIQYARSCPEDYEKSHLLKNISKELFKTGKIEEAKTIMIESYHVALRMNDFSGRNALKDITAELVRFGQFEEALVCAKSNPDVSSRIRSLGNISTHMAKQGRKDEADILLEDILAEAKCLDSEISKNSILSNIAVEFVNQKKLQEAIDIVNGFTSLRNKYRALANIAIELVKLGHVEKAVSIMTEILEGPQERDSKIIQRGELVNFIAELAESGALDKAYEFAQRITESSSKSRALMIISIERAKRGDYSQAEEIGFQIPQISKRYFCWKRIGEYKLSNSNWVDATHQVFVWQNLEAQTYYLKGIASSMKIVDCDRDFILRARKFFLSDIESLEQLFQNYGINMVFFQNHTPAVINRLNRTLNIQWAIAIKNQLPN